MHQDKPLYSAELRQSNEKDIIKKGSGRKGRYLCVFGDRLKCVAGGKIGVLAKLDSKNPVMYVDFGDGRLKFQGTLLFPKNNTYLCEWELKMLSVSIFLNV